MFSRTKIVCTIGPAVCTIEKKLELIDAGMNVARINLSHGTVEEHKQSIEQLKEARSQRNVPLAIMLDTKGPEIRVETLSQPTLFVKAGQRFRLSREPGKDAMVIHPFEVVEAVSKGTTILFSDGYILSKVVKKKDGEIWIEIQNEGTLKEEAGINIPGVHLNLPAMTPEDIVDLKFACSQDVDLIAASFIRSAHHVLAIKKLLAQEGGSSIQVVAKIENSQGVANFDSIVQAADGIMVARGDLGVELDLALVPKLQKMMIRKCYQARKPVITATQMLESMIQNPRPTRAEVSDVANAIYDSTSAIMLSAETAVGKYPIETVKRMKSIVEETERDFNYREFFERHSQRDYHDPSSAVALAAVKTAYSTNAKAIFAFTTSGTTARLVSRLRPSMPVLTLTSNPKVYHQMALYLGVVPILRPECENAREAFDITSSLALKKGFIAFGDMVVVTAGSPYGKKGSTNMMIVESIGDVIIRGLKGFGAITKGKIAIVLSPEEKEPQSLRDCLVVTSHCDPTFFPLFPFIKGLIVQNHMGDRASSKYALTCAKNLGFSVIVRADSALSLLKEGEEVTLDPQAGLVYREGNP